MWDIPKELYIVEMRDPESTTTELSNMQLDCVLYFCQLVIFIS